MDVQTALLTRRTAYTFDPARPLPEGVLDAAILAAHHAPNHHLTIPWRFTVAGPRLRERLADLYVEYKEGKRAQGGPLPEGRAAALRRKVLEPAELVLVSCVRHEAPPSSRTPEEDESAVSAAIQNLLLSLHARGVGSKWDTGGLIRMPETYEALGVDPDRERIVAMVLIGYPASEAKARRPPVETVIRQLP